MNKFKSTYRSSVVSLRTVILSGNFWLAVILVYGALFAEISEDVFHGFNRSENALGFGAAYFFNISLHFGYFIYAAPLACAFAASGQLINDTEAGFFRLRLLKSGKREYSLGLFAGSSLGGGLALMTGVLLFAITCTIVYGATGSIENMATLEAWYPLLFGTYSHWKYMIVNALLAFLFGMLWSGVGLTISIFSLTRYVSYLAPFIICFCSTIALPVNLQPLEMLVQMNWRSFSFPKLLIYQGSLYLLVMLWFNHAFERRIIHGQD